MDKTENKEKYSKLKANIIALKEYVAEAYNPLTEQIDHMLTVMNDLLFGIERGQLVMPYKRLFLPTTYNATDGAFDYDSKLRGMLYQIQDEIYSLRTYIEVQEKTQEKGWFRRRKSRFENVNWLFPNLDCKIGHVQCIMHQDQDMLEITFPNGYGIDLGYLESEYIITITKNDDWTNIIEEEHIKLRCLIEERLQHFIYKYENLKD